MWRGGDENNKHGKILCFQLRRIITHQIAFHCLPSSLLPTHTKAPSTSFRARSFQLLQIAVYLFFMYVTTSLSRPTPLLSGGEEATLSKPPLNVISRKTTTIARVVPAWNGSTSWWRSNSNLTKGNIHVFIPFTIKTRLFLGRVDPEKHSHRGHSKKFPFEVFRFSIFYGFFLFTTSRAFVDVVFTSRVMPYDCHSWLCLLNFLFASSALDGT